MSVICIQYYCIVNSDLSFCVQAKCIMQLFLSNFDLSMCRDNSSCLRIMRDSTFNFSGLFGFLTYEVEEGKKLFFHMSEVNDGVTLTPGDTVEFVLVTNQRTGKSSACNVTKIRFVCIIVSSTFY